MIKVNIHTQPDDETCGPTCLQAVYDFYGQDASLEQVIQEVERSHSGGTLAPLMGKHALKQGFDVRIYINNLDIFDPTWFHKGSAEPAALIAKLDSQMQYKQHKDLVQSSQAYKEYLELGGEVRFTTLSVALLKSYFDQNIPIITGLSATYLYESARERYSEAGESFYDDIRGTPCGHFVLLCGYDQSHRHIVIADPHRQNPLYRDSYYKVSSHRLINAILLGVYTYDANLLIIEPRRKKHANHIGNG